jgi:hypothetical protein
MKKYILILNILLNTAICLGQKTDTINDQQLFAKGIYLENLKILLPWHINFTDLSKIGNPMFTTDTLHRGQINITWDSITILNGIKINLTVKVLKKILVEVKSYPVRVYNFTTDSNGVEKLKNYFAKYTGRQGALLKGRKFKYTRWVFYNYYVETGLEKSGRYFLRVIKNH